MPYGYCGKILHVNLTERSTWIEEPDEGFYRRYVGGSALGMYYLLKYTSPGVDPLDPENPIIFACSVATGVPISGLSRLCVTAKSPLTGLAGDSQSGGFFPAELKFSGYDAIVVRGKAKRPVYISIINGEIQIRSAEKLWGRITGDVDSLIKADLHDDKVKVIQCGIAAENGVQYASIMSMSNRANGRNGLGLVMARKNLKAIAVRGNSKPAVANPNAVNKLANWGVTNFKNSDVYGLGLFGTASIVESQNEDGGLPTWNWNSGTFTDYLKISGKEMAETILLKRDTCFACTVRCKRVVGFENGEYSVDPRYGGPEYETIAMFGSSCGISDLKAISYANQLCNMYGLDTISCGGTIAWAMECYEKGILNKKDTGGLDLHFGNSEIIRILPEMIALRHGFGDVLALGSRRAAEFVGKEAEKLVVTVKNQEYPAHMPQVKPSLALIYAVNPFGADHQSSEHDPSYEFYPARMEEIGLLHPRSDHILNEAMVDFALKTQYAYSFMDSVNACQFVFGPAWQLYSIKQLAEVVGVITGWNYSVDELLETGARRLNMMRAFNAREGTCRNCDTLPEKIQMPLHGGKSDGLFIDQNDFEVAKDIYYRLAGWDAQNGNPTQTRLKELGVEWINGDGYGIL